MGGLVVAIDGPSGSGKSTTAKRVAERLGLRYLDTGAMYRGVAVACLRQGVGRNDADGIAEVCRTVALELSTDAQSQRLAVDGVDATIQIREPAVSAWVSAVATNAACRAELVRRQRVIIGDGGIVVEGRDITTVVAPDADVRVLLVADPVARLARRGAELGDRVGAQALEDQVLRRDRDDSLLVNFTDAAPGVSVIDSTYLTIEETVDAVVALVDSDATTATDRLSD